MKPFFLVPLFFALLAAGCTVPSVEGGRPSLPEKMPPDFAFSLEFGINGRNAVNTFDHTVTKDLIAGGVVTANIALTTEELEQIYERMRKINIADSKKLIPDRKTCLQTPHGTDKWNIRINGNTITHQWSGEYCNPTPDALQLGELRDFVFELVKAKDEYKRLPEATGGYD
ncbi:hypothetical protein ACFQWB_13315 [Paenibacillus thermoaerophilus]|uniref:Lipoprotein n=1 Tax=Paenibacillus thermoaerophilus TaxID=1215385 RepID=A0ABW2V652_9BACL|nr:hypothetical protein [Paenibacillus thermoaerophilus]TMV16190.1 hypothetical protein FE781_09000 [Paenibacillus thermoaerophilus]